MVDEKVQLVSRTKNKVTVRLRDGSVKTIHGRDVTLVYCTTSDLDAVIANKSNRQTEIDCTLHSAGLLIFGTANYV